jgi:hypothetical protein
LDTACISEVIIAGVLGSVPHSRCCFKCLAINSHHFYPPRIIVIPRYILLTCYISTCLYTWHIYYYVFRV